MKRTVLHDGPMALICTWEAGRATHMSEWTIIERSMWT